LEKKVAKRGLPIKKLCIERKNEITPPMATIFEVVEIVMIILFSANII